MSKASPPAKSAPSSSNSAATPSAPPKSANALPNSAPNSKLGVNAHYEKIRHGGQVLDCAVLIAIGINTKGKRSILIVSDATTVSSPHAPPSFPPPSYASSPPSSEKSTKTGSPQKCYLNMNLTDPAQIQILQKI
jgi:hypothetical protein